MFTAPLIMDKRNIDYVADQHYAAAAGHADLLESQPSNNCSLLAMRSFYSTRCF